MNGSFSQVNVKRDIPIVQYMDTIQKRKVMGKILIPGNMRFVLKIKERLVLFQT